MRELVEEYYEELLKVPHYSPVNFLTILIILSSSGNTAQSFVMIALTVLLVPIVCMTVYRIPTRL